MSIEDDIRRVLLALANHEKVPADPERGQHALEGDELEQVTGLGSSRLQDAVDVLDERKLVKRHKFVGDPVGEVRLNAQGRLEAEKLIRASRGTGTSAVQQPVADPLAVRQELLDELYKLSERAPQAQGLWSADGSDPLSAARAREAAYLKEKGLVSGTIGGHGDLALRLTASGRDFVEARAGGSRSTPPTPPTPDSSGQSQSEDAPEYKLPRMDVKYAEKLGSGAFGTVWRGTDQLLDREIAVKFLTSTDQALDEDALLREARSLAKLTHQNLVRVYGAAWLRHPLTGLVAPAITMELLAGEVLETWWARQHSREEAFTVIIGFLSGVRAMHAAGLHHGDLHPRNVMVLADGTAKIIDWRYQDTFLLQSTAHRNDLIESEQRRAIDLVVSLLEKQALVNESLAIRGASEVKVVLTAVHGMTASVDVFAHRNSTDLGASDTQRERTLQLRKLEAEARIVGRLISNARNLGANDPEITLQIENLGRSGFSFESCEWRVEWNHRFHEQIAKYNVVIPDGYVPPSGRLPVNASPMLPPGRTLDFRFKWARLDALAHFRDANVQIPGFNGAWADYHFEVVCRGELGGEEVLRWTERPTTP